MNSSIVKLICVLAIITAVLSGCSRVPEEVKKERWEAISSASENDLVAILDETDGQLLSAYSVQGIQGEGGQRVIRLRNIAIQGQDALTYASAKECGLCNNGAVKILHPHTKNCSGHDPASDFDCLALFYLK